MADEAISEFTKEVDGKTVPMWSREEIDEIIMGQVFVCDLISSVEKKKRNFVSLIQNFLIRRLFSRHFSC